MMATTLAILVFGGALAAAIWTIHLSLAGRTDLVLALLRGEEDPRFTPAAQAAPLRQRAARRQQADAGRNRWRAAA